MTTISKNNPYYALTKVKFKKKKAKAQQANRMRLYDHYAASSDRIHLMAILIIWRLRKFVYTFEIKNGSFRSLV